MTTEQVMAVEDAVKANREELSRTHNLSWYGIQIANAVLAVETKKEVKFEWRNDSIPACELYRCYLNDILVGEVQKRTTQTYYEAHRLFPFTGRQTHLNIVPSREFVEGSMRAWLGNIYGGKV